MSESDGEGVQFFEGVEKLLEIWFVRSENDGKQSGDLRKIPRYVIFHNRFPIIYFTIVDLQIPTTYIYTRCLITAFSTNIFAFISIACLQTKFSTTDLTK